MVRFITIIIASLIISGCAGGSQKPTVPSRDDGRKACPTSEGTIIDMTEVMIEGPTEIAQGTGAALGGYTANRAAKNESEVVEIVATVAGAAVGSVAGDLVSKNVMSRDGVELMVYVNGVTHSIIQESDINQPYAVGQDVWVVGNLTQPKSWGNRYNTQPQCASGIRVLIKR
jgi:outer membrane lipoprotein SlyB